MKYADFQFLKFETKPNGVLLITLNRPEVMNATNARLHWELTQIWSVVNDDPATRVVVVTGAGDRAFSAGGDLNWIAETVGNAEKVAGTMKEAGDIVFNMLACDKPIISAINGVAFFAGLAVAQKLGTGSQQAIRLTKRSLNNWMRLAQPAFDASLAMEMLCFMGDDVKEGVAALREKREPKFPSAQT